ncbi:MAG: amidophosphoribosyltransferase [Chloroflexi bacterium]|nr:MAG: amidophosphoribosyltransferase [Chloroflexota bacterium]
MNEECGIFGVYAPGTDVARLTFFGLYALQHRGQESAGIAVTRAGEVRLRKQLGLVGQVFDEDDLRNLRGDIAVGHARYSTTGSTLPENAGPMAADSDLGTIVVSHNGNIVNALALREELLAEGVRLTTTTDSELLTHMIARADGLSIVEKLRRALGRCIGAYSLAILTPEHLVGVRDPNGIRPLCIGRSDAGWILASESCALATVGASLVREVEPGEIVVIDTDGIQSYPLGDVAPRAMCVFEMIYFSRPDSLLLGERVHLSRQRMGEELAKEHPRDADIVVPVPDSAIPAAIGYARASGIPYADALIKNRYIGRTFIQPDQHMRERGVQLKFNALPEVLEGQRVVLIDDTIVRGTTSRPIVQLLRSAGAREVHMLVHAPPIMWPCYLGVDMATREELIAARHSIAEIAEIVGVDYLGYLSLEGLYRAVRVPGNRLCSACLTGQYPVPIEVAADKHALERQAVGA